MVLPSITRLTVASSATGGAEGEGLAGGLAVGVMGGVAGGLAVRPPAVGAGHGGAARRRLQAALAARPPT